MEFNPGGNVYGGYPPVDPKLAGYPNQPPYYHPEYQGHANQYLDPVMANVAMHYGNKLMGSGKEMVDKELNKYVSVSRLKYYFAVDSQYVLKKIKVLLFPFGHGDWSLKYREEAEPCLPRHDVNAPDLYIPLMGYITYVLIAGLALGTQDRFSPEVLGILASQALAWTIVELLIEFLAMYLASIETRLGTLDLLAFSGYKFLAIILVIGAGLFSKISYYVSLVYLGSALACFTVRSLKGRLLSDSGAPYQEGTKRRMYLLALMGAAQPALLWWLSYHLL